ncbi:MAG: hypothetical protein ABL919_09350 [Methylococcales bacterium]|nr:hypothetical protein [Methylococcaceae bacterium]
MKNSFFLVIPKQESNPLRLKEFEEKPLQNWINELPTANPSLSTRLIHDFFAELRGIEMPAQLRLSALELVRPSMLVIEDYLRSRLVTSGFPKEETDKKIFNVLVTIERFSTISYWIALKELTERDASGWFQGKNIALAIQRCIKGLSSVIITHYIMGQNVPDWVWIDLHSLYRLSVKSKKDTTKVANDAGQLNKASSPEECYLQILLLSLADPAGLMQKEIFMVFRFIETLVELASFKTEPVIHHQRQVIIQTDEDLPPFFDSQADKADNTRLYLDLVKIYKLLANKQKLGNTSDGRFTAVNMTQNNTTKPSLELLDYLEQRWTGLDNQVAALFADRLDRFVAIGLDATYELLTSHSTLVAKDSEILMHSASDRYLSHTFEKTGVISVGSLVSVRKSDMPEHRRALGIVIRVSVEKQSEKIIFGLQLMARQIFPVTYTLTAGGNSQKGVFYGVKDSEGEKGMLLTDSFVLKNDDTIWLTLKNEDLMIILGNRRNIGLGYWQFECRRLAEHVKAPVQPKKGYDFI